MELLITQKFKVGLRLESVDMNSLYQQIKWGKHRWHADQIHKNHFIQFKTHPWKQNKCHKIKKRSYIKDLKQILYLIGK